MNKYNLDNSNGDFLFLNILELLLANIGQVNFVISYYEKQKFKYMKLKYH